MAKDTLEPAPFIPPLLFRHYLNQPLAYGVFHQFRAAVQAQLGQDICPVSLDGLAADHELVGDFLIGPTVGNQFQNLAFALGQTVKGGVVIVLFGVRQIVLDQ